MSDLASWRTPNGEWVDGVLRLTVGENGAYAFVSPTFSLESGLLAVFSFFARVDPAVELQLGLQDASGRRWKRYRIFRAAGESELVVTYQPRSREECRLVVAVLNSAKHVSLELADARFELRTFGRQSTRPSEVDTCLPHWGPFQRTIHRICKRSRAINAFVAGVEARLGREEVLSLPLFMALCPTGQCNALCDFCSVTISRSGIIKKQLPFDEMMRFVGPARNTVRQFGIEGNGEPTLYKQFDALITALTSNRTDAYLITNGSRLKPQDVPLLLELESVNFSLNACAAETHRAVMKLKNFDEVVAAITRLVKLRGVVDDPSLHRPRISVSFVVTNDNVHEAQDFLAFSENVLGVDIAMIRPLSELGNEIGAVEDLRNIVPYESDIADMIEAVEEYRADSPGRMEIRLDAATFRSVRPDPVGAVRLPGGFENRLLPPRRSGWTLENAAATVAWSRNELTLRAGAGAAPGPLLASMPIPVTPNTRLEFRCRAEVNAGHLFIAILDENGTALGSRPFATGVEDIVIGVETAGSRSVRIVFSGSGGRLEAVIGFDRLRRPAPFIDGRFRVPGPSRWEVCSAGTSVDWHKHTLSLSAAAPQWAYLVKSYTIPCAEHRRISLPIRVEVEKGRLGIGVLDGSFSSWITTLSAAIGVQERSLEFDTGANSRVQIVLYTESDEPLKAKVRLATDLPSAAEASAAADSEPVVASLPLASEPSLSAAEVAPQEHPAGASPSTTSELGTAAPPAPPRHSAWARFFSGPEIYCHKPWTDLHNFTVDGRMDVCCIATGASQERYQLGNLRIQTFQEVWNGKQAREFRRTVNSPTPLPPCVRCPMSHAYQGMWFEREHTVARIEQIVRRALAFRGGRPIADLLVPPIGAGVSWLMFRRFRKG